MSHVSKYAIKIKNLAALKRVLERKGIKVRENVMASLYGSNRVQAALEFKLPGWKYACAVNEKGEILYDHYGSKSSTLQELGLTIKAYNKEVVMAKVYGFATNWWEEETKMSTKLTIEC